MRALTGSALSLLVQFLDSKNDDATMDMPLPYVAEMSQAPARARPHPKSQTRGAQPTITVQADAVYVDCFYYGFWLPKSKLPPFQASLRAPQAARAH